MKRLLSVGTTSRSPRRVMEQLPIFIKYFNGADWSNNETKKDFFIRLIQHRLYDPTKGSSNPMSTEMMSLFQSSQELTYETANEMALNAGYQDLHQRGRTAIDTAVKLGFLTRKNNIIKGSVLGEELLNENKNLSLTFLKSLLKWQLPNPKQISHYKPENGFNVVPLQATIKLIDKVNKKEIEDNKKPKGLSRDEFNIFVPTLINFNLIDSYAEKIISLRRDIEELDDRNEIENKYESYFYDNFSEFYKAHNYKTYADNLRRYFFNTNLFRDNDYYFNFKPDRQELIEKILELDNSIKQFENIDDWYDYIGKGQVDNISLDNTSLDRASISSDNFQKAKTVKFVKETIEDLDDIINRNLALGHGIDAERFLLKFFWIIDTTLDIKSNANNFDADGLPVDTAPAYVPDLVSKYNNFFITGEITTMRNRSQIRENEIQSTSRHIRSLENANNNKGFLLFVAPIIHRDVLNQFHYYTTRTNEHGFEDGRHLNIVPLNFEACKKILGKIKVLYEHDINLTQNNVRDFFQKIVDFATSNPSNQWTNLISSLIDSSFNNEN